MSQTYLLRTINYASNTSSQEYDILRVLQSRVCRSDIISVLPKRLPAYVVTVMHGVITYEYYVSCYCHQKIS